MIQGIGDLALPKSGLQDSKASKFHDGLIFEFLNRQVDQIDLPVDLNLYICQLLRISHSLQLDDRAALLFLQVSSAELDIDMVPRKLVHHLIGLVQLLFNIDVAIV